MSEELSAGLAATANESAADSPTQDAVLDAAFASPEPAAGSEPSGEPASVEQPVAATQPPQTTEQPSGAKGEPPRERWDTILANARTKAREDALAEHRDHLEVVQALKSDFSGTLARLLEEAAANPQYSEAITAKAAALLNSRRQSAKANTEPEPDLQTADGALVYSAPQLRKWQEWNQSQTTAKLTEQFKPLQELQEQFAKVKQQKADLEKANAVVKTRWSEWESMPFLKENMDAVKARQIAIYDEMEANAKSNGQQFDYDNAPFQALSMAYREVISSQVLPKLQSQQTDSLVAQAARKRAASSSDPAANAPAQPRRPRTPDEALDQVFSAHG